ncbi:MAG: SlyX family protein [Desulfovibrionaceae bacterium]
MEERIVQLEEVLALQGRELEQLSGVVAGQQREIDELKHQLKVLGGRYREMRAALKEQPDDPGDPLPPHYLP